MSQQSDEPEVGVVQDRIDLLSQHKPTQEEEEFQVLQWKQQREKLLKLHKQKKSKKIGSTIGIKSVSQKPTSKKEQQKQQYAMKMKKYKKNKHIKNKFAVATKLRNLPNHDTKVFETTEDISMHVDVAGTCSLFVVLYVCNNVIPKNVFKLLFFVSSFKLVFWHGLKKQ